MNWSIWLTEKNATLAGDQRVLQCNAYPIVLQAARQGQGIALGWSGFVDDDLRSGVLVRPLKDSLHTRYGYYLVQRYNQAITSQAQAFKEWLQAERLVQTETTSLPK